MKGRRQGWSGRARCRKCGAVGRVARLARGVRVEECRHAGLCGGRLARDGGGAMPSVVKGYPWSVHEPPRQVELFGV